MKVDWLIVGAGFTGSTLAERLATQMNKKILVVDKRDHIGGNAYDEHNTDGILTHLYGPHIFHTNSEKIWHYLSQFTSWRSYHHHVLAVVDGKEIPLPFNLNSLQEVFPAGLANVLENALISEFGYGKKVPILELQKSSNEHLRFLADFVYNKVFLNYTRKQWGLRPEELDASVTGRVPIYISRDDRYFQDKYQGLPEFGYTRMFKNMLSHKNIKTMLNTDYKEIIDEVQFEGMVYTGPIDAFFDHRFGNLPYRSLEFKTISENKPRIQKAGTVNYPNDYDYTRITEQTILTGQESGKTTLIVEYPQAYVPQVNEPYYPIPREENRILLEQYLEEARKLKEKVIFAGRLADYKYYNMDQACGRALSIFDEILKEEKNGSH
ncbi:UDP-galactopyranose mutase [Deinococcus roseus]|uniref:UDP-galactopyranose mutase n=1 Tax=Deinococcus roseus TaxID=392414 RepID=A0ABQ2CZ74_9DEIO|nr:UDP-galactopyranose mutase [Deinococcus roseus]GGJ35333.1 UDP-galactopyranose mutase [Deinococcus roseus]